MKPITFLLTFFLGLGLLMYLAGTFIFNSGNPGEWHIIAKAFASVLFIVLFVILLLVHWGDIAKDHKFWQEEVEEKQYREMRDLKYKISNEMSEYSSQMNKMRMAINAMNSTINSVVKPCTDLIVPNQSNTAKGKTDLEAQEEI